MLSYHQEPSLTAVDEFEYQLHNYYFSLKAYSPILKQFSLYELGYRQSFDEHSGNMGFNFLYAICYKDELIRHPDFPAMFGLFLRELQEHNPIDGLIFQEKIQLKYLILDSAHYDKPMPLLKLIQNGQYEAAHELLNVIHQHFHNDQMFINYFASLLSHQIRRHSILGNMPETEHKNLLLFMRRAYQLGIVSEQVLRDGLFSSLAQGDYLMSFFISPTIEDQQVIAGFVQELAIYLECKHDRIESLHFASLFDTYELEGQEKRLFDLIILKNPKNIPNFLNMLELLVQYEQVTSEELSSLILHDLNLPVSPLEEVLSTQDLCYLIQYLAFVIKMMEEGRLEQDDVLASLSSLNTTQIRFKLADLLLTDHDTAMQSMHVLTQITHFNPSLKPAVQNLFMRPEQSERYMISEHLDVTEQHSVYVQLLKQAYDLGFINQDDVWYILNRGIGFDQVFLKASIKDMKVFCEDARFFAHNQMLSSEQIQDIFQLYPNQYRQYRILDKLISYNPHKLLNYLELMQIFFEHELLTQDQFIDLVLKHPEPNHSPLHELLFKKDLLPIFYSEYESFLASYLSFLETCLSKNYLTKHDILAALLLTNNKGFTVLHQAFNSYSYNVTGIFWNFCEKIFSDEERYKWLKSRKITPNSQNQGLRCQNGKEHSGLVNRFIVDKLRDLSRKLGKLSPISDRAAQSPSYHSPTGSPISFFYTLGADNQNGRTNSSLWNNGI